MSGVLYARLDITGRDDKTLRILSAGKNKEQAFRNADVFLYPASAHMTEFARLFDEQHKIMENSWLGTGFLRHQNKPKQIKNFLLEKKAAQIRYKTKTDEFGRYSFTNIKPGKYFVWASGWFSGSYNKEVYAGSSNYNYGGVYGVYGSIDHTKLVNQQWKTFVVYSDQVTVAPGQQKTIDSRLRVDYNQMAIVYGQ